MNRAEDWFPEGQEAWGNSGFTLEISEKELNKRNKEYRIKREHQYKEWLKKDESKRELAFDFLTRYISEKGYMR